MKKEYRPYLFALATAAISFAAVTSAEPRFTKSEPVPGETVVEDRFTRLVWQGCSAGQSGPDCSAGEAATYGWQQASDYCDTLVWGGYDDWALPGVKELRSIVDNRVSYPAIDEKIFPQTVSDYYWTASVDITSTDYAWSELFDKGYVFINGKYNPFHVRCVRLGS